MLIHFISLDIFLSYILSYLASWCSDLDTRLHYFLILARGEDSAALDSIAYNSAINLVVGECIRAGAETQKGVLLFSFFSPSGDLGPFPLDFRTFSSLLFFFLSCPVIYFVLWGTSFFFVSFCYTRLDLGRHWVYQCCQAG
ncbi:uncharacterized protein LDX57_006235 [Aspergillus melleus]|uniref:uncharacterized protein n=1 Tax=Aspergillus melleus TaxID=138277 RepID=UPI001E8E835B|nr:uncharacterized protein LDX57_006235 [Aspergillus melleus]KAH8428539.1 hypothetical protein LDX57_006235 [Aspergillus melleus]